MTGILAPEALGRHRKRLRNTRWKPPHRRPQHRPLQVPASARNPRNVTWESPIPAPAAHNRRAVDYRQNMKRMRRRLNARNSVSTPLNGSKVPHTSHNWRSTRPGNARQEMWQYHALRIKPNSTNFCFTMAGARWKRPMCCVTRFQRWTYASSMATQLAASDPSNIVFLRNFEMSSCTPHRFCRGLKMTFGQSNLKS